MRLELRVELKTVDLVRETAWLALTEKLGWAAVLADLRRAVLWRFELSDGDEATLRAALAAELERTSAFYNPNKERHHLLAGGALPEGEPLAAADALEPPPAPGARLWRALVWVTDEGGEQAALRRRTARRLPGLSGLRAGTLWELALRADTATMARGLAAGLALTRRRRQGLLLNPHYQEGRLLTLAPGEEA
ncbi:MAG: hypothetical protein JW819_01395 [Candidatus Krumholzibacteriota bacterium]|nr:hypothetical protein [Candidatus Krumholzibacteriota bacterium]